MIISNSLGKQKQDNFLVSSVLLRSDGFKKITKGGFTSTKALQTQQPTETKAKMHTSAGFRRYTKEYKLKESNYDSRIDCLENTAPFSRVFTPAREGASRKKIQENKKASNFVKQEQEEEECFRNICEALNIM